MKKEISRFPFFRQSKCKSVSPEEQYFNAYAGPEFNGDSAKALLLKKRLPGFIFGAFRNVAATQIHIAKPIKFLKLELIAEFPEVLNFNYIAIWARDGNGSLYKIEKGYECSMSTLIDALPDANAVMSGGVENSVSAHSRREVKPWWSIVFSEPHFVEFVEFYNRKDKWGIRARSIIFTGYDEDSKRVFRGGRILKKGAEDLFSRQALPLIKRCDSYLKSQGHTKLATQLESSFSKYVTKSVCDTTDKSALLDLIRKINSTIGYSTPDLPNVQKDAVKIVIPRTTKFIRIVGFRRKLERPVKLNISVKNKLITLDEESSTDFSLNYLPLKEHLWTLQHPHVFNFSSADLASCKSVSLWCEDFYSGDAFVQRIVQASDDGVEWKTLDSTIDKLAAHLALISMQEWVLGDDWDERFADHLGQFLATYRMSQARTVKPLFRGNKNLLTAFYDGVESGGNTATYLPPVIYTRHGLTVPFEHIDSQFLATRMKRFTDFLELKLNLKAFPCYGTLLGIHRDGDFLPHDDDIDLAVVVDLPENVTYLDATLAWADVLRGLGVSCKPPTPTSLNLHCYFEDFDMDLFFIYRMPEQPKKVWTHMQGYRVREVSKSLLEPLGKMEFRGYEFYAPAQIEAFLEDRYGKGWTTPDPTFEL
ncbi:LicD family protein [Paraglaciecola sp. T6c]|uniref:LicD family protein n=1 Tax=Pseudoalteromonas atlantica (strain T6c / ATCC BAA-1087) TaxID=3042615 RepID=UPI0018DB8C08|nr:LicD family protein [Paraglaciecola sp. T6c]